MANRLRIHRPRAFRDRGLAPHWVDQPAQIDVPNLSFSPDAIGASVNSPIPGWPLM